MKNDYLIFFKDIDEAIGIRFGNIILNFKLIGYAALALAGLPERGTKDVDALEETLKTRTLSDQQLATAEDFLKKEFGKGSPGEVRHGVYLDLVEKGVAWLPHNPCFIEENSFSHISVSRLHPVDVCISKTFSNFKRANDRARDRKDILDAFDADIIDIDSYISRLDETLPKYETHAEAPEVFPRVLRFVDEHLLPRHAEGNLRLNYRIPSWMENY